MDGKNSVNSTRCYKKAMYRKIVAGLVIAAIACLAFTMCSYRLFVLIAQEQLSNEFYELEGYIDTAVEDQPVMDNLDKLGFRLAIQAETDIGLAHISVEREETGEVIADSKRGGYLVIRKKAGESNGDSGNKTDGNSTAVYRINDEYLEPLKKYDTIDFNKRLYYLSDYDTIEYTYNLKTEFYSFKVKSAYIDREQAYPLEIVVSLEAPSRDYLTTTTEVDTIRLEPGNASAMEYVDDSDHSIFFLIVGNEEKPVPDQSRIPELQEALGDDDSFILFTDDSGFLPGNVGAYGMFRYTDSGNISYIVRYSSTIRFAGMRYFIIPINALLFLIITIISVIWAKKRYDRDLYEYSMKAYQNKLIDVMAHDLRTPLMAMSGYAENLKEEANSDKRDYYIDAILRNTDYMSQIITRNLELSKVEEKDIKKNYSELELVGMLQSALDEYKTLFEKRKISLSCSGSFFVKGSEPMMKTALENLVSNIVKYVDDRGEIVIAGEGKTLWISNTTTENFGNPKKLWEPFVRGDESRSNQNGTGLGLAITKSILDKHKLKSKIDINGDHFTIKIKR